MERSDRYIEIENINLRTLENLRNDLLLRTICVASLQNSPCVGRNESGIIPD